MKLRGDAFIAERLFAIVEETMAVVSGVHLHLPIRGISVPNSESQSRGILDTISDVLHSRTFWLYG